jgi:YD repeat-containing protein
MSDGVTPISGAAVSIASGVVTAGSSLTNASGNFTVNGLHAGTYTASANAPGYEPRVQSGVAVNEGATTTLNVSLNTAAAASIRFVYDEVGRLRSVSDLGGDTATYTFDATGNITSIERHSSLAVGISEFTPDRGPAGTAVTIYGTGFSQTPADNVVSFNGTATTVTAATATQLAVSVPAGAGSGPISVTTPAGAASSPQAFTVAASSAPTVTGFSPTMGAAGTSVTINGTNFSDVAANNAVRFDITGAAVGSASTQAITTTVPPTARSGHVSVATASGLGSSAGYFIIPPAPLTVNDVDSAIALQAGTPTAVTVGTANKVALAVFDGTGGRRAALRVQSPFSGCVTITIYDVRNNSPNPTIQSIPDPMSAGICGNSFPYFFDTWSLPFTGSYTIVVDPDGTQVGTVTLTLYDVPPDVQGTASMDGTPVSVNTPYVGQNAQYTFSGTANQRVSFWFTPIDNQCTGGVAWLLEPNADYSQWAAASCKTLVEKTLPVSGTYRVFVDPDDMQTGTSSFNLWAVPSDVTASVNIGGAAAGVTIGTPGQNGTVTFNGGTGQQVTVHVTASSMSCTTVALMNGTTQLTSAASCNASFDLPTHTLPGAGTYTISVDPTGINTGTMNVSVTSP